MNTRFLLLAIILYVSFQNLCAQMPSWQWAHNGTGTTTDQARSCTTDVSGNLYTVGTFASATIRFSTFTLNNSDNSGTTSDIFIVKLDASANVLWAKSIGGNGIDEAPSVATDASDNVYVSGSFKSPSIIIGPDTLTNFDFGGNDDIFVAKFDSSGNVLWAKKVSGAGNDFAMSIVANRTGNIFVTGYFNGATLPFGTDTLTHTPGGTTPDIFLVKYDSSGNEHWAKSATGTGYDYSYGVTADDSGNSYITGSFRSPALIFSTDTLYNTNDFNIFTVKYDHSGNELWARSGIGAGPDGADAIAADASGNVYVTGSFQGPVVVFGADTVINPGVGNVFLTKYDASGNVLWAKSATGSGRDIARGVAVGASGNAIMTGLFSSPTITFSGTPLSNADTTGNTDDVFIANYDSAGNVLWVKRVGGPLADIGSACAVDASGSIYVGGLFYSKTIAFGSTTLPNSDTSGLTPDMFIAKLSSVTGIGKLLTNNNSLSIYPNPSSGSFNIVADKNITNGELNVFNVMGEKIHSEILNLQNQGAGIHQIRLNAPSGIYFLQLKDGESAYNAKVVIEE